MKLFLLFSAIFYNYILDALISNSASQIKDTHEDFKPSSPSKSSEEDQMKDIAANSNQDDQSNKVCLWLYK